MTSKLTMVFVLADGKDFKYNLTDPKENLTKAEVDAVMQDIIDNNIILKDAQAAVGIKEAYITTTTQTALA